MDDVTESRLCTCATPVPVQRGTHKGASETVCARCDKPLPLTLGQGPRWAA